MRDTANSCTAQNQGKIINHLLFMDNLNLYGKSENEIKGVFFNVEVFSHDIVVELGIKKCGVIIMNKGKVKSTDGIKLSIGEMIREI